MSRWNRIPNEILTRIIDYNKPHYKYIYKPGWESVNKQWYYIFLSEKYRSIHIRLNARDPTINCILNSSFSPGLWVKNIDIMEIRAPRSINLDTDLLSWLMYFCPKVRKVYVNSSHGDVWSYFYQVLHYNGFWKSLETLARFIDPDEPSTSINYTNCLLLLTKSLRYLSLTTGMINPRHCQRLSDFTQIEVLEIGKDIVFDLYDCCDMICLLPRLQKLIVILSPLSLAKLPNPEHTDDNGLVKFGLTNINSLCLENFVPTNEKDLLFLMNQFPYLRNFLILGDKDIPVWPFKKHISLPVLQAFFRFIQRIESVKISFSIDDCGWFLEQYYEYHDNLIKRGRSNPVRITLSNDDPRNPDHVSINRPTEHYPIYVTLENTNTEITIEFKDHVSETNTRQHILTKTNLCVIVLDLDMRSTTANAAEDVGQCLKTIMHYQTNLKCLKFYYGRLRAYETKKLAHHIQDLEFEKVFIHDRALAKIMKDFPSIKQLTFDRCKFEASHLPLQHFNLHMHSTAIGHLQVVYEMSPLVISWVLFKVIQDEVESDIRYFLASSKDTRTLEEINYANVFGSGGLATRFEIAMFNIHCKSIKHLTFRRYRLPYQEQDQAVVSFSTYKKIN